MKRLLRIRWLLPIMAALALVAMWHSYATRPVAGMVDQPSAENPTIRGIGLRLIRSASAGFGIGVISCLAYIAINYPAWLDTTHQFGPDAEPWSQFFLALVLPLILGSGMFFALVAVAVVVLRQLSRRGR